jgi:hypothetical protein
MEAINKNGGICPERGVRADYRRLKNEVNR